MLKLKYFHVLHHAQEYFIIPPLASILLGGKRAVPEENPQPSAGCWEAFPSMATNLSML